MNKWSRNAIKALIEVYRANPSLYDIKSSDYYNQQIRDIAVSEMVKVVSRFHHNITAQDCKAKYKIVRNQFMKELKKLKISKIIGNGTGKVYKPTLWCFKQLYFLRDFTHKRRRPKINCPDYESSTLLENYYDDNLQITPDEYDIDCTDTSHNGSSVSIKIEHTFSEDSINSEDYAQEINEDNHLLSDPISTNNEDKEEMSFEEEMKSIIPSRDTISNAPIKYIENINIEENQENKSYFGNWCQEQYNSIKNRKRRILCNQEIQNIFTKYLLEEDN